MVDAGGPQLALEMHVNKGFAKTSFLVSSSLLALRSSRIFFGTPSGNLNATRRHVRLLNFWKHAGEMPGLMFPSMIAALLRAYF